MYEYGELKERLETFLGKSQRMSLGLDAFASDQLIYFLEKLFGRGNNPKREDLIRDVQNISPGKVPIWFRKMIYGEEKVPCVIESAVRKKAWEIYETLYVR